MKLGITARDTITGFEGVVTATAQYISGCNQVLLVPKVDDKGAFVESHWFDEQRCSQMGEEIVVLENEETPGPDKEAPKD